MKAARKVEVKFKRLKLVVLTVCDDDGTRRFIKGMARHLVDKQQVDLNKLHVAYQRGEFSTEDMMRFYFGLGYSITDFEEVFIGCAITLL